MTNLNQTNNHHDHLIIDGDGVFSSSVNDQKKRETFIDMI